MYKIEYNKNKKGNDTSINYLIVDGKDIDMMRYSLDMELMGLYGNYLKEPCESMIIFNNNNQNKKEIKSILRSRWLINATNLDEDIAGLKLECIDEILLKLNEKLLDRNTQGLDVMIIRFEIILYNYAKETLENYLNEKKEDYIKRRIKE